MVTGFIYAFWRLKQSAIEIILPSYITYKVLNT